MLCFHKIDFLDSEIGMSEESDLRNNEEQCAAEKAQKGIPRHVAVIMDGNGRWAQKRGLERMNGHIAGVESLRNTIKEARISGVEYLTVYAFSTENWGRPEKEVDGLMNLFCKCLEQESAELNQQGVRLMFIGNRNGLNEEIRLSMESCEKLTEANDKLTLIVAFNYSARQELIDAAAAIGSDTAFFVRNTPQLCSGRGEIMTPVELPIEGLYLVVAKPDDAVSTKEAYGGAKPMTPATPLVERLAQPVSSWQGSVKNDFEPHIFEAHPKILELKNALLEGGAMYAAMSGSGSAVFGIFADKPQLDMINANYLNCIKL